MLYIEKSSQLGRAGDSESSLIIRPILVVSIELHRETLECLYVAKGIA